MAHGKIELGDVLNFFEYEKVREEMRRRVIALKRTRRVPVGPYLSFVFENRDTLLFQIQEMCRVERITDDARIQDEIEPSRIARSPVTNPSRPCSSRKARARSRRAGCCHRRDGDEMVRRSRAQRKGERPCQ